MSKLYKVTPWDKISYLPIFWVLIRKDVKDLERKVNVLFLVLFSFGIQSNLIRTLYMDFETAKTSKPCSYQKT